MGDPVQYFKLIDLRGEQQDSLWVKKEDYDALLARVPPAASGVEAAPAVAHTSPQDLTRDV